MMLDAKRTFDDLVDALRAGRRRRATRCSSNPIYRELSNAVAGSQEYMAMEKLHELHQEGRYDLLVLDTPPTRNALDFLDAPRRLSRFIDSRSLQFFRAPAAGWASASFGKGTGVLFSVLKRATGVDLLQDLADFFNAFGDMADGFRERAERVERAARRQPHHVPARDLAARGGDRGGRAASTASCATDGPAVRRARSSTGCASRSARPQPDAELERAGRPGRRQARGQGRAQPRGPPARSPSATRTTSRCCASGSGASRLIVVPELAGDVHDLDGLAAMNEHLFA